MDILDRQLPIFHEVSTFGFSCWLEGVTRLFLENSSQFMDRRKLNIESRSHMRIPSTKIPKMRINPKKILFWFLEE